MNLADVYAWATDPDRSVVLKQQLAAAIATAAVQVLAEDEKTFNHPDRVVWAHTVLATPESPGQEADQMIWGVLGNGTIQGELAATQAVPDSDLQFVVNSLIDVYAH